MSSNNRLKQYWRANLLMVFTLLTLWFLFSVVFSIVLVEPLNKIQVAGFPLGFWMAQQGSMIVFIFLILAYVLFMARLDRKYGVEEEQDK